MNFASLIKARKVLDPLWKKSWLRGRTWGPIREDNPYSATNITMATKDELVSISQDPDGSLKIHEFSKTRDTDLGKEIKEVLTKESIKFREEEMTIEKNRKDELSKLSTEELQEKLKNTSRRGLDYLRSRDEDDMEDSFFEPSRTDPDERVIREILRERGIIE